MSDASMSQEDYDHVFSVPAKSKLKFARAEAKFWRLRYLAAANVTDANLEFVVRKVTEAAVEEERRACAKVCDDQAKSLEDQGLPTMAYGALYSATAIRARGET